VGEYYQEMDRERVRFIVKNMDLLVQSLKNELEGPPEEIATKENVSIGPYLDDYDEIL
jgi:hypothetical protein